MHQFIRIALPDVLRSLTRGQKVAILTFLDGALVPVALRLAHAGEGGGAVPGGWLPALGLALASALFGAGLGLPRIRLKHYDLGGIGRSALQAAALFALALGFDLAADRRFGLPVLVDFALFFFLADCGMRLGLRQAVRALYRGAVPQRRVLIYGAGTAGMQLAAALRCDRGFRPVAFVDDNPALQGLTVAGLRVHRPARLAAVAAREGVTRVLIAQPALGAAGTARLAARLAALGLEVQALPSFAAMLSARDPRAALRPLAPHAFLGRAEVEDRLAGLAADYGGRVVLVTGAGGSIGSELCRQILALGAARLILLDHSEYALYAIERELAPLAAAAGVGLRAVLGNIGHAAQMRALFAAEAVEVVLHAAAYKHVPMVEANPLAGLANNVLGTEVLARAARAAGVARFVMISSDKAVKPTNVMGASKRLAEIVVQDLAAHADDGRSTVFAMVRFGNVLGSSGSVLPLFQEQIARGGPVTITGPEVTRYFMTVEEAVALVLRAGAMAAGGEVFLLDMGRPVRIGTLARQVIEASGHSVRDAANPEGEIEIVTIGLRPGEKPQEELLIGGDARATAHPRIFAAHEAFPSQVEVAHLLRALRRALETENLPEAHAVLSRWVEGYAAACPAGAQARRQHRG